MDVPPSLSLTFPSIKHQSPSISTGEQGGNPIVDTVKWRRIQERKGVESGTGPTIAPLPRHPRMILRVVTDCTERDTRQNFVRSSTILVVLVVWQLCQGMVDGRFLCAGQRVHQTWQQGQWSSRCTTEDLDESTENGSCVLGRSSHKIESSCGGIVVFIRRSARDLNTTLSTTLEHKLTKRVL